jgi:hypothetical protein
VSHRILRRLAVVLLLAAPLAACSADTQDAEARTSLDDIVARLQHEDAEVRKAAAIELYGKATPALSTADAILMLRAAGRDFPPVEFGSQDASAELLRVARSSSNPALVEVVRESFSEYPPRAKEEALLLLSSIDSIESTDLFVRLAVDEARNPTGIASLPTRGFEEAPRHADRLFPALFAAMERAELRWGVAHLALTYFEQRELAKGALDAHYGALHELLVALLQRTKGLERSDNDWMWADDYQEIRGLTGLLLDLGGFFETDESLRDLVLGLESADPRLKFFSARALMAGGRDVPDAVLRDIAAASETRNSLFEYLESANRLERFPKEFLSQEALAESEMVDWLIYPTELARAPSEIEVVRTVDATRDGDDYIYYVFKFRTNPPHWAAEDGWMLGVAGPFLGSAVPSATSYGDTFSTFAKLDETDIEGYVEEIRALLEEKRARQLE